MSTITKYDIEEIFNKARRAYEKAEIVSLDSLKELREVCDMAKHALPPPSQQAPGKDGLLPMTPERLVELRQKYTCSEMDKPSQFNRDFEECLDEIQRLTRPSAAHPSPDDAVGQRRKHMIEGAELVLAFKEANAAIVERRSMNVDQVRKEAAAIVDMRLAALKELHAK